MVSAEFPSPNVFGLLLWSTAVVVRGVRFDSDEVVVLVNDPSSEFVDDWVLREMQDETFVPSLAQQSEHDMTQPDLPHVVGSTSRRNDDNHDGDKKEKARHGGKREKDDHPVSALQTARYDHEGKSGHERGAKEQNKQRDMDSSGEEEDRIRAGEHDKAAMEDNSAGIRSENIRSRRGKKRRDKHHEAERVEQMRDGAEEAHTDHHGSAFGQEKMYHTEKQESNSDDHEDRRNEDDEHEEKERAEDEEGEDRPANTSGLQQYHRDGKKQTRGHVDGFRGQGEDKDLKRHWDRSSDAKRYGDDKKRSWDSKKTNSSKEKHRGRDRHKFSYKDEEKKARDSDSSRKKRFDENKGRESRRDNDDRNSGDKKKGSFGDYHHQRHSSKKENSSENSKEDASYIGRSEHYHKAQSGKEDSRGKREGRREDRKEGRRADRKDDKRDDKRDGNRRGHKEEGKEGTRKDDKREGRRDDKREAKHEGRKDVRSKDKRKDRHNERDP
eukprot:TRINITY_DN54874_c0_g1_i1.p1 TRINITY_DN54874_c0_g1~~TRINITY_DN54874_c0_g1_i1.p1  ORF type:complete len:496 (-),score=105.25 TRINITY_DN54874_c0_g1_i1:88-1575(-)